MMIFRSTYSICYTCLPTALCCSVLAMLLLLPKAVHAQSTTLRPTSAAGTDTPPPSALSSTASCDYGMSNCLRYNCNGCNNLFDDSCWGCHKCCAGVKRDCIKGQVDAVGFDKCGNGQTPQTTTTPTQPTLTPTLRSTFYPSSDVHETDTYTMQPTATPTQRPMQNLRSTLYPTSDEYETDVLEPTPTLPPTPWIEEQTEMPAYTYDYPPFIADAEEEEEEEEEDSDNLSDAAAIAIKIFGTDAEEEEEEGDSKNLSNAGAIAIKFVGIVLATLWSGFVFAILVKWMFMCDAPSGGDENSENNSRNVGGNRTAAAAVHVGESAVAAERLEVSPSTAEVPPVPVASAVLTGTGTSGDDGDIQDPPLAKVVKSMSCCDNAVSGVSSSPPPPSAPPAE